MVHADSTEGSLRTTPAPRAAWIDAGRIVAILAVIAIHVASSLVTDRSHEGRWWFANLVESAARWCVPLFVMISGSLLLPAQRTANAWSFYRRRLSRIGVPLLVWTVVYLVVGHVRTDRPATWSDAAHLVLAGIPYFHMYFVYLIAGLYVVAPFLQPLARSESRRLLYLAAAVFMVFGMADLLTRVWGGVGGVNGVTRFVPYIGYFLAGVALTNVRATRTWILVAIVTMVVGIGATAIGTAVLIEHVGLGRGRYLYEYLSVTTVPVTLAVFLLFAWSTEWVERLDAMWLRWLSRVAALTFGIYLVHPLILIALRQIGLYNRSFFAPLAVLATVLAAFALSAVAVAVLRSLPLLRRVV